MGSNFTIERKIFDNRIEFKVRVNTSEENRDVQPEDFDLVSHQSLLMEGMNQLRIKEHLLDVKLMAEGRYFKVSNDFKL